jgi:hypothetical protein
MLGPEINPAARAELGLLSDHAGGYPLHVRDLRTAQAECIAHASRLLVGGVGPAGRGPDRQRDGQNDSTPKSTAKSFSSKRKSTHVIPQITPDSNSGWATGGWQADARPLGGARGNCPHGTASAVEHRIQVPPLARGPATGKDFVNWNKLKLRHDVSVNPWFTLRIDFRKRELASQNGSRIRGRHARSISSISNTATNSAQTTANSQANFRQSLNQLFSDVSSGNLSDAQQSYSTLSNLQNEGQGPSATSNTPLAQTLNQIGQSLQNGDISGAQQALSSLQQTQQAQQTQPGGHHHHGHHGGSISSTTASTSSTNNDNSSTAGNTVDITA